MSCLVDYKNNDYRGFIFVVHDKYGLLLLKCTRKKNKPMHWQVPGGHVDESDFLKAAARLPNDRNGQLLLACKMGAARELYEETGIDLRTKLDRIEPTALRKADDGTSKKGKKDSSPILPNEYKRRLFYFLKVSDEDFCTGGGGMGPVANSEGRHLKLKISVEHSGWMFQPEPTESAEMLKLHSGGKVTEALIMAKEKDNKHSSSSNSGAGRPPIDSNAARATTTAAPTPAAAPTSKYYHANSNGSGDRFAVSSLDGSTLSTIGRRRKKRDKEPPPILDTVVDVPVNVTTMTVPPPKQSESKFCCFKFF